MERPVELGIGQVLASLPYLNSYQVRVRGYGTRPGIDIGSGSERLWGHRSSSSYAPGTWVLVAIPRDFLEDRSTDPLPVLIIGGFSVATQAAFTADNPEQGEEYDKGMQWSGQLSPDSKASFDKNNALKHVITKDQQQLLAQDRSFGRLLDAGPGDWYKINPLGGLFLLTDFMARMMGSPNCGIWAHYFGDVLGMNFRQLLIDGETYRQEWLDRGNTTLALQGIAFNFLEAMGGFSGVPAMERDEDTDELSPIAENQASMWRMLNLGGGDVEGLWAVTRASLLQDEVVTRDTKYFGLVSEQRRMDGIYRLQAAKEIRLEKTLEIRVPEELKDVHTQSRNSEPPEPPETQLWQDLGYESEDEMRTVADIVFRREASWEELNEFNKGLRQDVESGIWRLATDAEISERLDEVVGEEHSDGQLPPIGDMAQEYTLEDIVSALVEIYPGRRVKLFRNSSVFLMADDGGFTICDAFGAGIKAHRGVLELMSSVDVRVRTGRDLIFMAPGNIIHKAGGYVETTSTEGSILQKAERNIHILSGNGGAGSTILENRASQGAFKGEGFEKLTSRDPIGSGIVVKSPNGGIALLGNRLYIGGSETGDGLSSDGSDVPCEVVVNCGKNGQFVANAGDIALLADTGLTMSLSSSLTGMFLNSTQMMLINPGSLAMVSSAVYFDEVNGRLSMPLFDNRKLTRKPLNASIGPPVIVARNNVAIKGGLQASEYVQTKQVSSRDGVNGQLGLTGVSRSSFRIDIPASQSKAWEGSISSQLSWVYSAYQHTVNIGWATEYGQKSAQLKYPDSDSSAYRAGADWRLYSLRWQALLASSWQWEEKPVEDAILGQERYPYPGTEVYERKSEEGPFYPVAKDGALQDSKIMDDYPVNVQVGD